MELAEQLCDDAMKDGIEISIEQMPIEAKHVKAMYLNIRGKPMIIVRPTQTQAELVCLLAEELGHYHTNPYRVLQYHNISDLHAEAAARRWGYRRVIAIDRVIKALRAGLRERCDVADYLGVTEVYLEEAIDYYRTTDAWQAIENEIRED